MSLVSRGNSHVVDEAPSGRALDGILTDPTESPPYEEIINFTRQSGSRCVMCGKIPGSGCVIPKQNKDVCRVCEIAATFDYSRRFACSSPNCLNFGSSVFVLMISRGAGRGGGTVHGYWPRARAPGQVMRWIPCFDVPLPAMRKAFDLPLRCWVLPTSIATGLRQGYVARRGDQGVLQVVQGVQALRPPRILL